MCIQFIQGRKRSDLESDTMLYALMRAIEIIGEAAAGLSQERRAAYPDIPWPQSSVCEIV